METKHYTIKFVLGIEPQESNKDNFNFIYHSLWDFFESDPDSYTIEQDSIGFLTELIGKDFIISQILRKEDYEFGWPVFKTLDWKEALKDLFGDNSDLFYYMLYKELLTHLGNEYKKYYDHLNHVYKLTLEFDVTENDVKVTYSGIQEIS